MKDNGFLYDVNFKISKGERMKKYNPLQKALSTFQEATRLSVLYGMILITPAKEIKRMKLRQIKKDLKKLKNKTGK